MRSLRSPHVATRAEAIAYCEHHAISIAIIEDQAEAECGIELFQDLVRQWPFMRGILISQHLGIGMLTKIVEARFDDCLSLPLHRELLYESVMRSMRSVMHWQVRFREHRHNARLSQADLLSRPYCSRLDDQTILIKANALFEDDDLEQLIRVPLSYTPFVLIDFSDVIHVRSEMLGCLVYFKRQLRDHQSDFALYGLREQAYEIFHVMQLLDVLNYSPNQTQALRTLRQQRLAMGS